MAAVVEICESNGGGETITHNVSHLNCGSTDAANLVAATYPITVGGYAYIKYWRYHWTSGAANKIDNLRVWKSAGTYDTGIGIQCNLRTSSYGGAVTYAQPVNTQYTDQTMAVADPGGPNLGIGGTLAGNLASVGYSDYCKMQLGTTGSSVPGNITQLTLTMQYDEQ